MAGLITHMVVIREILKLLPENTIQDVGLFYLGSLAPDAVHQREGYVRAFKKHTHFRDDIPDRDFELPENYKVYQRRLIDFINDNINRSDNLLDLYRGYVVHILADELFLTTVRKEFCDTMKEKGIDQNDHFFFEYIVTDMMRNDSLLTERYEDIDEIRSYLEQVKVQAVESYISEKELEGSLKWLLQYYFYLGHEKQQPVYISYQRTLEFIHTAASEITKRLSDNDSLPKMF